MSSLRLHLVLLLVLAAVPGCSSSTRLTETWVAPDTRALGMREVLVAAIDRSATQRRVMEDAMVQAIGDRARATPSYRLVRTRNVDSAAIARVLRDGRFDGVWTLRTIGTELRERYVPGSLFDVRNGDAVGPWGAWGPAGPWNSFWGYWNYGWGLARTPGYIERDEVVRLESNLYRTRDGEELVWSGITETIDPRSTERVVSEVARTMARDLDKRGLLRDTDRDDRNRRRARDRYDGEDAWEREDRDRREERRWRRDREEDRDRDRRRERARDRDDDTATTRPDEEEESEPLFAVPRRVDEERTPGAGAAEDRDDAGERSDDGAAPEPDAPEDEDGPDRP